PQTSTPSQTSPLATESREPPAPPRSDCHPATAAPILPLAAASPARLTYPAQPPPSSPPGGCPPLPHRTLQTNVRSAAQPASAPSPPSVPAHRPSAADAATPGPCRIGRQTTCRANRLHLHSA